MAYLTFERYADLGGRADKAAFGVSSIRAEAMLNEWTLGRLESWKPGDPVVELALVEIIDAIGDGGGREVASFSNGVNTVSFAKSSGGPMGELYDRVCAILPVELVSTAVRYAR